MAPKIGPSPAAGVWRLAREQHGVVTRRQLLDLGFGPQAIKHRIASGRLHRIMTGVYAIGRPRVSRHGRWMAAVLACGPDSALSHECGAALWGIGTGGLSLIEVSVPRPRNPKRPGIVVHRRAVFGPGDVTRHHGIPVTTPVCTLIDLAARLREDDLEAAVSEADKLDVIRVNALRAALAGTAPRPGAARLRILLDRRTFTLTDSQLERRMLPVARRAGLAQPLTGQRVCGFKVDFHWPELGLVVETDGLRYHRTPAQQTRDRRRDQAYVAAGLTPLRFTHAQVAFEPGYVQDTLTAVARRLMAGRRP